MEFSPRSLPRGSALRSRRYAAQDDRNRGNLIGVDQLYTGNPQYKTVIALGA